MSLEGNISDHQATRIKEFIKAGVEMLTEIDHRKTEIKDRNDSIKELAKTVGGEVEVDAKDLLRALNVAFKNTADEERLAYSTLEELLAIAGVL